MELQCGRSNNFVRWTKIDFEEIIHSHRICWTRFLKAVKRFSFTPKVNLRFDLVFFCQKLFTLKQSKLEFCRFAFLMSYIYLFCFDKTRWNQYRKMEARCQNFWPNENEFLLKLLGFQWKKYREHHVLSHLNW